MQIKLYEEKRKDGTPGRILIILDDPGKDLAEMVKATISGMGGSTKSIDTVAPEKSAEATPSVPESAELTATAEVEELFADAPEPVPETKPAPKQEATPQKAAPVKTETPKPAAAPAPKQETKPAPAAKTAPSAKPAPKKEEPAPEENSALAEAMELWELLDDDSKEEFLANFGVGSIEDVTEDEIPTLLDMLRETV